MTRPKQPLSGQALVADYQTVFVSTATIEAAHYEASRSENELVQQLEDISAGTYLNPGSIEPGTQDAMTRLSLDAHIKKVQARQLSDMNAQQLAALIEESRSRYIGRKVKVSVLPTADKPIDVVWFDERSGYRTSTSRKTAVTGVIEDVLLDRNVLILRPTWGMRLLNSHLRNYLVYIINPADFSPMVSLTFL